MYAPPPPPPPTDAETWVPAKAGIRKRLLRRIANGEICGVISGYSSRPCMATPMQPGGGCLRHAKGMHRSESVASPAGKMLRALVQDALSLEESLIFDQVFSEAPTLETEIASTRVKMMILERDRAAGLVKDDAYFNRWEQLADILRKLVTTNQRARIAEETLRQLRDDPSAGPDAYDPLADTGPEGGEGEG